jgi:hypothetical protein
MMRGGNNGNRDAWQDSCELAPAPAPKRHRLRRGSGSEVAPALVLSSEVEVLSIGFPDQTPYRGNHLPYSTCRNSRYR